MNKLLFVILLQSLLFCEIVQTDNGIFIYEEHCFNDNLDDLQNEAILNKYGISVIGNSNVNVYNEAIEIKQDKPVNTTLEELRGYFNNKIKNFEQQKTTTEIYISNEKKNLYQRNINIKYDTPIINYYEVLNKKNCYIIEALYPIIKR